MEKNCKTCAHLLECINYKKDISFMNKSRANDFFTLPADALLECKNFSEWKNSEDNKVENLEEESLYELIYLIKLKLGLKDNCTDCDIINEIIKIKTISDSFVGIVKDILVNSEFFTSKINYNERN